MGGREGGSLEGCCRIASWPSGNLIAQSTYLQMSVSETKCAQTSGTPLPMGCSRPPHYHPTGSTAHAQSAAAVHSRGPRRHTQPLSDLWRSYSAMAAGRWVSKLCACLVVLGHT